MQTKTIEINETQIKAIKSAYESAESHYRYLDNYERTTAYPGGFGAWRADHSKAQSEMYALASILEQAGAA